MASTKKVIKEISKKSLKESSRKTLRTFKKIIQTGKKKISKLSSLTKGPKKALRVTNPFRKKNNREAAAPSQNWQEDSSWPFSPSFELPEKYEENKLVLLVRDPWWLFSYWEIMPSRERNVLAMIERRGLRVEQKVMRVYDVTGKALPDFNRFFDIEVGAFSTNWYVDVGEPDREWIVEIGFRTNGGHFFMLVRSNTVRTPRYGLSDVLDEEWLLPEDLAAKIFGLSAGFGTHQSSLTIQEMLQKYIKNILSSGNISSMGLASRAFGRLMVPETANQPEFEKV